MAKFKILFVDDDPEYLQPWAATLESEGYAVIRCSSEQQAKAVIARELKALDLAVIDLKLADVPGDTSGLNVATSINGAIPIIILTGGVDITSVLHALNARNEGLAVRAALKADGPYGLLEIIRATLVHRVFVSHGHDPVAKRDVVLCLKALGVQPLLLQDEPSKGIAVAEAMEAYSNVSFAVILLTPDDVGATAAAPKVLHPRARQNVIWEWGFFIGRLGREHVAVLNKCDKNGPIDLPSNYLGVRYIEMDENGEWRSELAEWLSAVGIAVDAARVEA